VVSIWGRFAGLVPGDSAGIRIPAFTPFSGLWRKLSGKCGEASGL
jgi:hypothetical protein